MVECKASAGMGGGSHRSPAAEGLPVVVTFGLQQGSRTQAWCYDISVVVRMIPNVSCTSGSIAFTLFGKSLGSGSFSALMAFTSFTRSQWNSDSTLLLKSPAISSGSSSIVVTSFLSTASLSDLFTYCEPRILSIDLAKRSPTTGSLEFRLVTSALGLSDF